ncbi:hypothetical protein SUDANB1_07227 [Streptomyces sp. enrichment culture]
MGRLISRVPIGRPSFGIMKWEPEIPRWRQVYAVMSERILDGTYPPEGRLPSAMGICDEFGISQVTAKRVLTELRKAGLAEMQPGIGTFVTELPQPPKS